MNDVIDKIDYQDTNTKYSIFDNELDSSDLLVPIFRISKDTGYFINTVSGEEFQELSVVMLRMKKSRVLWPRDFSSDSEPLCKSTDSINPDNTNYTSDDCKNCTASMWLNDERPECSLQYNYLVLHNNQPGIMSFSRARLRITKSINTLLKINGMRLMFNLTTKKETTTKGEFWQLAYSTKLAENPNWFMSQAIKLKDLQITGGDDKDE